jgi:DNA polymerase-4
MFQALKLCPDAVVLKPDGAKYRTASRAIFERMHALTPLVQPVSIDEAYLDLSGTGKLHGAAPAVLLARLARDIESDLQLTVSIGLSSNKFLAKTASELEKPRGFAVIAPEDADAFLAPKPPAFLHGIGPKLAATLEADGYTSIGDLQSASLRALIERYGETGLWLKERSHGRDNRPVDPVGERKSVSAETTFLDDIKDRSALEDHLWQLCVRTADRAKAQDVSGSVVTLKLKTAGFQTLTRRVSLADPTQLAQVLFRAAQPLLAREATGRTAYRLIGVGLSGLENAKPDAVDLIDARIGKRAIAERASDAARAKFGSDAVFTGRAARMSQKRKDS